MQKIIAWIILIIGIAGVFFSIYGYFSTTGDGIGGTLAWGLLGIVFLAALAFINLGVVILRNKISSVYGNISTVFAIVLGIIVAAGIWLLLRKP